jgi:hypothetical protein
MAKASGHERRNRREKAQRDGVKKQLDKATGFAFLAQDDVKARGLERRGEAIGTVYCALVRERTAATVLPERKAARRRLLLEPVD